MTEKSPREIDWSLTTWKGSRRRQHLEFLALPFARKLECIEEIADFARSLQATPVAAPRPGKK